MSNIIVAETKTVKAVLGEKYAVDFYQREYKWRDKQVAELVNDLVGAFIPQWGAEHEPQMVRGYRGYFLGSIIVSERGGDRHIVDGQQRLTTLTLLLIALRHRVGEEQRGQLAQIIRSLDFGEQKFNLDIPEREECLAALYEGAPFEEEGRPESVRNILRRHREIEEMLSELRADEEDSPFPFPRFADWLIGLVRLVEIKAASDGDAYAVFETMNDRGLSLTPTEMLKGYLLAKISDEGIRNSAGDVWKRRIGALVEFGKEEDADAIKAWLRGRHARSIRERRRNAIPQDFDRIGSEFHRWVREKESVLGLETDGGCARFITEEFEFYSSWYLRLRCAANELDAACKDKLESVYHNAEFGFTLQYPVLLASLSPGDSDAVALPKLRVVSAYLDILIHRRVWSSRNIGYSTMSYAMFLLMRELRGKDARAAAECLVERLADPFMSAEPFSKNPRFHLHGGNKRKVRQILARMTAQLEEWAEVVPHYAPRYADYGKYEIEHIWADKYAAHGHGSEFAQEAEFQEFRDRIGGLLLLRKADNASYNDKPYAGRDGKLDFYFGQNLLAKSLHERCYENNPGFLRFVGKSGLPFKPHPAFKKSDLEERQALYLQIAERIWNPDRLRKLAEGN